MLWVCHFFLSRARFYMVSFFSCYYLQMNISMLVMTVDINNIIYLAYIQLYGKVRLLLKKTQHYLGPTIKMGGAGGSM